MTCKAALGEGHDHDVSPSIAGTLLQSLASAPVDDAALARLLDGLERRATQGRRRRVGPAFCR